MSDRRSRRLAFARLFSSAVVSQGLLSAASFAVGLIFLRYTPTAQYGLYVLALNALMLLVSLQNAFFGPPLAIRITQLDGAERARLVGGLYREQRRVGAGLAIVVLAIAVGLWSMDALSGASAALLLVTVPAGLALISREYFRMVLLAHRLAHAVLRADVVHVALLVSGALVASRTAYPALTAIATLGVAALASGGVLWRALLKHQDWQRKPVPGLLRQIAPMAAWSTAGSGVHWAFSQGYIYLVAATLGTSAVAALAATRLLLMPVNLLSTGIGSLMLPTASAWLQTHGAALVLRRLQLMAAGMTAVALAYFLALWLGRDWLFAHVLRAQIPERDTLLLLWGAIFLLIVIREQIIYLIAAQGRFRTLTLLTLASALLSLAATWWGIRHFGIVGALCGVLLGELINLAGIVLSSGSGTSSRQTSNGMASASSGAVSNSP